MKRIVAVILLTLLVTLFMLPQSFAMERDNDGEKRYAVIDGEIDEVSEECRRTGGLRMSKPVTSKSLSRMSKRRLLRRFGTTPTFTFV